MMLLINRAFHNRLQCTVQLDGSLSSPFPVESGIREGFVLALTFFSVGLRDAFGKWEKIFSMHTRFYRSLFNPSRLKAKTKIRKFIVRKMFAI